MECEHGWRDAMDCDTCTAIRVAPKAMDRVAALEDRIRYALDLLRSNMVTEAQFELDRALSDPDFQMPTTN